MRRRIAGLDINGRFDLAARDWGEDGTVAADAKIQIVFGGICTAAVTTKKNARRIAGPQAGLAPHGRGQGWGDIGEPSLRRLLAPALDRGLQDPSDIDDLRAAADALARGADEAVVAVPDVEVFNEVRQGALIAAMEDRRRRVRLLWRPVAAFLDLLQHGDIPAEADGERFRILVHTGSGLEDQTLTLRSDPEHPGHVAPQRDGVGRLCAGAMGLDALFARAGEAIRADHASVDWTRCEPSRLGPALLTGGAKPGEAEVLRAWNANWTVIVGPEISPVTLHLDEVDIPPPDAQVAGVFLITALTGPYAQALAKAVASQTGPVTVVGPEAVARGCLRAGRLIERGLPHYFDRLEPVAIAVLKGVEPSFEHLIEPGSVVAANREYVSREISDFEWRRGKPDTEFYVLKGEREVRHWTVSKPPGPPENVPVSLRIRQTPGQSWARLALTANSWDVLSRNPVALDWESLTPLDLTPQQILEKLRRPPPPIPERIVERSHIDLWTGSYWSGDGRASSLAVYEARGLAQDPYDWATLLSRSQRNPVPPRDRFWLVGTDGDLPEGLDPRARKGLYAALERMAQEICSATLSRPPKDNDRLRALTWCFSMCPDVVQERILEALEANAAGVPHPLTQPSAAMTVLRQGAGRSVTGVPRLTRLFLYLASGGLNNDRINALAMALSRREEAPEALKREQVDHFLRELGRELLVRIKRRDFKVRFRNTLSALAGLFRWRVREPYALLASQDPVAAELRESLVEAKAMLEHPAADGVAQRERKVSQIEALIEFLDGRGDPDILHAIEREDFD